MQGHIRLQKSLIWQIVDKLPYIIFLSLQFLWAFLLHFCDKFFITSSATFHTNAIVLRSIAYGNTSLIITTYTALFGLQTYIVKGIRTSSKKQNSKASYFLSGNILELVAYHQQQKNIHFIKEYQFAFIPKQLQQQVVKNAVLSVILEIVLHTVKQPDANEDLFYYLKEVILFLDEANPTQTANLILKFCLDWAALLGFGITTDNNLDIKLFDIQSGVFTPLEPKHAYYVDEDTSKLILDISKLNLLENLDNIKLNKYQRKQLLDVLILFLKLHVENFGSLRSVEILSTILA